ncbi:MAG: thrombospondin type 3 repeat-containing protein, partial [Anaerolineae bacterium]|nr:thrombospondin type 3 repeat-containing protein [Anaerolineae bacterium]
MNQTQPNTRTVIGLIIGAIVLVAGLLLISNAGRSGDETPPPSPTRVSLQPTATPEPEPSPTPAAQTRNDSEDPDGDGFLGATDLCPDIAGTFDGCPDTDNDGIPDDKDVCPTEGDLGYGIDGTGCPNPPTDRDGDGIFDNEDTCPDNGDEGNGIDSVGCPLAPPLILDTDNDGIADDSDSCPTEGDLGNGVDGTGCPIPVPTPDVTPNLPNDDSGGNQTTANYEFTGLPVGASCQVSVFNGDALVTVLDPQIVPDTGIISGIQFYNPVDIPNIRFEIGCAIVPDSAPAIMPYRFENVGAEDTCSVQVVNVGDGEPANLSDLIPVTPDENGVVQGEIGILLGANDTPEVIISCIGTPPLPPAVAAFEYSFEIPSSLNCTIMIVDEGGNIIESFPAVPDESGFASGVFEYDPGVILNPTAQIGCVPNVAPAVMPYEFTGLSDVICTVTIVNVGDGDPADFGSAGGLVPDDNGTISGAISILVGANDVPEAVIACVPASAPIMIAYEYTGLSSNAICTLTVMNMGDGEPADLGVIDGLTPDENGVISGTIAVLIGDGDNPELDLSCLLTIPAETTETVGEAIAAQTFTFSAPDDFPPDVAFCDVVVNDGNLSPLQTYSNLVPDENGVIEVLYEYTPGEVLEPISAFIFCAIADDFGNPELTPDPEVTPIIPPSLDYNLSATFQCLPIPEDARSFAQVGVNVTATGNYPQSYQMTWVSGDTTIQNNIGLNLETGSLAFNMPLGTGQASATLTLVAYDETATLVPAETWIFDAPPCAETA